MSHFWLFSFSHFWPFLKKDPLNIFENWSNCSSLGIFSKLIREVVKKKNGLFTVRLTTSLREVVEKNGIFTVRLTVRVDPPPYGQGVVIFSK